VVKSHPSGIDLHKKAQIVKRANQIARGAGDSVAQVKVMLRDHIRRIWIADSAGLSTADEQVFVSLIVQVVCARGDALQMSYEAVGGTKGYEIFNETPPEEIAAAAAKRAILMLDAMPAPSGPMPVVLGGTAGGTMIHEAVGHGLEADLAGEGLSVYRDRLGKPVASPLVSVYDDATLKGGRGSYSCDDEGAPAQKTLLIENGLLKSYMHNRISAIRSNGQTTGNGRRQNYAHPPLVRMSNTLIAEGDDSPEEILKATQRGLFVKKMGGGQVNTVNGDFVFDVQEGYRIEGGMLGEPVRGATLTGNGPKVLELIDKVGSDLGFSIGTCGKLGQEAPISCGQPTIRIPEITVGGTG
jgi:TldD protein